MGTRVNPRSVYKTAPFVVSVFLADNLCVCLSACLSLSVSVCLFVSVCLSVPAHSVLLPPPTSPPPPSLSLSLSLTHAPGMSVRPPLLQQTKKAASLLPLPRPAAVQLSHQFLPLARCPPLRLWQNTGENSCSRLSTDWRWSTKKGKPR